ncbi:hypothetical protein SAMN02745216_03831 [Desulfatibacillum alkenivorans DSM 16219]|jgi:hypothetical protein|uniref:Uncharacterized protein n=2 Tax=Desulfatibacillum alkenivorans TaxID=259354 RepID=A0A1M6U6H1_9BACT|nr:hypothetical protein SAMN02745216_03831 [Desulfatibacillum alkenivorans DSM 16219]
MIYFTFFNKIMKNASKIHAFNTNTAGRHAQPLQQTGVYRDSYNMLSEPVVCMGYFVGAPIIASPAIFPEGPESFRAPLFRRSRAWPLGRRRLCQGLAVVRHGAHLRLKLLVIGPERHNFRPAPPALPCLWADCANFPPDSQVIDATGCVDIFGKVLKSP